MRVVTAQQASILLEKVSLRHCVIARFEHEEGERPSSKQWAQLIRSIESTRRDTYQEGYQWGNISTLMVGFSSTVYPTIKAALEHMLKLTPEVHAFESQEEAFRHILDEQKESRAAIPKKETAPLPAPTPPAPKPDAPAAPAKPAVPATPAAAKVAPKAAPKKKIKRRKKGKKPGPAKGTPRPPRKVTPEAS